MNPNEMISIEIGAVGLWFPWYVNAMMVLFLITWSAEKVMYALKHYLDIEHKKNS